MSTDHNRVNLFGKDAVESKMVTKAIDALNNLKFGQDVIESQQFDRFFDAIIDAQKRGHSDASIIDALKESGFDIHPAKFKKLLKAKIDILAKSGSGVPCHVCKQPWPNAESRGASEATKMIDSDASLTGDAT